MKKTLIILLHTGYWLLYLLLIFIFFLFFRMSAQKAGISDRQFLVEFSKVMSALVLLPAVVSFYSFYYFLFPRFLSKRKIFALCLAGTVTIISAALLGVAAIALIEKNMQISSPDIWPLVQLFSFMLVLAFIHGVIALVMRGFIHWYGDIRVKEELQQKNLQTELALVKSQLNPHFLFNTINNIDVLIEKDPQQASVYLNKLSDIMRFMLYETKTEQVSLQKELEYVEKYIALQKIRNSNINFIQYRVDGNAGTHRIAPMLFMPFIENAFKHSVQKKMDAAIVIHINISNTAITFYCANHCSENPLLLQEPGGLGNELMQKRLQLLYPGKHIISIEKKENLYTVQLTIQQQVNEN